MRAPVFDDRFRSNFLELLRWCANVKFRSDDVPPETVDQLVHVASLAPSAGLAPPWRFVRVDDAARRQQIVDAFERGNADALHGQGGETARHRTALSSSALRAAPIHLAIFTDTHAPSGKTAGRATTPETLVHSSVMAVRTLWLAALAQNIGVEWISMLDPFEVTEALNVPPTWEFTAYLCMGYPEAYEAAPEITRSGREPRDDRATEVLRR